MEPIFNSEKVNELNEKMFAISIIDDPVFARQLYQDLESCLPISVMMNERGIQGIKEQGVNVSASNQVYEIRGLLYAGDMGGILCNMYKKSGDAAVDDESANALLMSITHLRFESSHPLAKRIKEYQKTRTTRLAIADSGRLLKPFKSKKNKKGFGS